MSEFYKRIERREMMRGYLADVSALSGADVVDTALLSPEESRKLLLRMNEMEEKYPNLLRLEREFGFLQTEEFRGILALLQGTNSAEVYLWLERTKICGMPPAISLQSLDFSFGFDFCEESHFSLGTTDFLDKFAVNWFENRFGRKMVELRFEGKHWGCLNAA